MGRAGLVWGTEGSLALCGGDSRQTSGGSGVGATAEQGVGMWAWERWFGGGAPELGGAGARAGYREGALARWS